MCPQEPSIRSVCLCHPGGESGQREFGNREGSDSFSTPCYCIESPFANLGYREPSVGEEPADENPPVQCHNSLLGNKKAEPSLLPEIPKRTPTGTTSTYTSTGTQQIDKTNCESDSDCQSGILEGDERDLVEIHVSEPCTDMKNDLIPDYLIHYGSELYLNRGINATENGLLVCAPTESPTEDFVCRSTHQKSSESIFGQLVASPQIITVRDEDDGMPDLVSESVAYQSPTEAASVDSGYSSLQLTTGYPTVGTDEECSVAPDLITPVCPQEPSIRSVCLCRPGGDSDRSESGNKGSADSISCSFYGIDSPSADLGYREPPVGEELNPPAQGLNGLLGNKKVGPSLGPSTPKRTPIGTSGKYTSTGTQQDDKTSESLMNHFI
jgi:hypothetical protein